MPLPGLTIIGETINDSVPSTKKLFDAGDIPGILEIAKMQDEKGAAYIDVNIGPRPPEFMAEMVKKIQGVTSKPLSIDTPDPLMAEAGLKVRKDLIVICHGGPFDEPEQVGKAPLNGQAGIPVGNGFRRHGRRV